MKNDQSFNPKIAESTVLHFSTTYENTNSSVITNGDESFDSFDELNSNETTIKIGNLLLPLNIVIFKILDSFSIISEKHN